MPQVGETKTIDGVTGQWTGTTWRRQQPAAPPLPSVDRPTISHPLLDMIPGLSDTLNLPFNLYKGAVAAPDVMRGLVNHPLDTLKGFLEGSSEAATPMRTGTLALLTGGATLPAALGAAGAQSGVEALRGATGAPNAATSFPQAASRVIGAAAVPGLPAGIGAGARKVARVAPSLINEKTPGVIGAGLGGYEGYKRGGITGAVEGATLGGVLGSKLKVPQWLEGLLGGAEAEAAPIAEGYVGPSESINPPRRSAEVPGSTYREPQAREPYHVGPAQEAAPAPPTFNEKPLFEQMDSLEGLEGGGGRNPRGGGPIASGRETATTEETPFHERPLYQQVDSLDGLSDGGFPNQNPRGGGPIASGRETAKPQLPTGRVVGKAPTLEDSLSTALKGLETGDAPTQSTMPPEPGMAGTSGPSGRDGSVYETARPAQPTPTPVSAIAEELAAHPVTKANQTVDDLIAAAPGKTTSALNDTRRQLADALRDPAEPFDLTDVPDSPDMQAQRAYMNGAEPPVSLRALARHDDRWGSGALDTTGEPVQGAGRKGNLLYDAGTDSEYLRQQLREATDPAEREFLAKSLAQRYIISRRLNPEP